MKLFAALTFILSLFFHAPAQPNSHAEVLKLMGTRFEITAVGANDSIARQAVQSGIAEIKRIESLISSWDSTSETSLINRNAGKGPVRVSYELAYLISRSRKVSALTGGAFDISYGSMDRVWRFDGSMTELPSPEEISASVEKVGFEKVIVDLKDTTVFLRDEGMKIGFGAIGKGYAANRAREIMKAVGATGGLVNAGGDLICWGESPRNRPWRVGIADPRSKQDIIAWVDISEMAVVTSGNYERFIMVNGEKYSHIIHPKTGWPVKGLQSVTVICPDAELADALATAVFVMGKEEGLSLINQLKGVECLLIDDKGEIYTSGDLRLNYLAENNEEVPELKIGEKRE